LAGEISLETLCIFVNSHGILQNWDSKLQYDLIWEEVRMKVIKYTPFVKYDKDKMMQIMLDVVHND
jgi:signal transduction histidine kinase